MNEKRLFDLREYKDLSQIKLADYLGITQQTYSLWEKGTKIIPLKHLNSLSNFYEISMDYIVGLTDEKNNSSIIKLTELNTTSSTISAYETGKTLILTAFAYQICIKYNVSLDWLCGKRK